MKTSMEKTVSMFSSSIVGIRAGTVTAGVIDTVKVPYYGQLTPIQHLATTGKTNNGINVDPFDPSIINTISKCLVAAGFNAYVFSKTRIIVSVPPPSGDEKKRIISHLEKLGEETKISLRNIRKNIRQKLDKEQLKNSESEIQKITDFYINEVDEIIQMKVNRL